MAVADAKLDLDETMDGDLVFSAYYLGSTGQIVRDERLCFVQGATSLLVTATPDKITIRGARAHEKEVRDENYLCQECYWGRFSRSVIFPQEVDPESAQVTFKNGILTVRLPKAIKKKTKKLRVKAD